MFVQETAQRLYQSDRLDRCVVGDWKHRDGAAVAIVRQAAAQLFGCIRPRDNGLRTQRVHRGQCLFG